MSERTAVDPILGRGVAAPRGRLAVALRALRLFIVRKRLGALGLFIVTAVIGLAIFAPLLSRYDPTFVFQTDNPGFKINPSISDLAANPSIGSPVVVSQFKSPGGEHWFGTDKFGRDIYARVVYGSRLSLFTGIVASLIAVTAGLLIGVISAYYRGVVDLIAQRFIDALYAFPGIVLLLLLVQVAEPSIRNTVIAMGVIGIPITQRLIRSAVLSVRASDFVQAAEALGASDVRIMFRHVLPNIASVVIIAFSIGIGAYIIFEATISFLGVGPRNVVSWGKMIQEGRTALDLHPWLTVFAGVALAMVVVGFNFLGDALRDVLDPRLRGR